MSKLKQTDANAIIAQAVQAALAGRTREAHKAVLGLKFIVQQAKPERDSAAWVILGNGLVQSGGFAAAEGMAREVLKMRASHSGAAALLARALFCTERMDEALIAAQDAARLAPADFDACLQIIMTQFQLGRPEDALAEAEAFALRNPGVPDGFSLRGQVMRRLGRSTEAVDILSTVAAAHPDHFAARLWLAHARHDLGDNDGAALLYRELIRQAPEIEEAHWGLSNTLADAGKLTEAASVYSMAARSIPGFNQRWPEFLLPLDLLSQGAAPSEIPGEGGLAMVLAFVPFERPVVPISPAVLKAYVERHSAHHVTAMDLNARFFQALRKALAERLTPFELADTKGFLAACDFLSSNREGFTDPVAYQQAAASYLQQITSVTGLFSRQCMRVRQFDGPIPWHARAMARALVAHNPAVVGLSAMFDAQLPMVHALARAVRSVAPDVKVVLGGSGFSKLGIEGLLAAQYVDYIVLNDGDHVLTQLLNALAAGEVEPQLPGLCYRRADGSFATDADTSPIKQDTIPAPNFDDYDLTAYFNPHPVLPVLTSRGCYWRRCTFCNGFSMYAGNYSAQSVTRVVDEFESHVRRYGVRHFYLVDKMISAARFRKIGEEILARGLDITYYGLAKPTSDFTPEIFDVMFRSGCRYLHWGQESGNNRILDLMDKGNTVESSVATLRAAAAAGIRNHLFMIIGFPTEGMAELSDTIRFLCDTNAAIDQVQCGPFVLEKGTPLHTNPEKFGITAIHDRRSEGALQLVRFQAETGFTAPQAQAAEQVVRNMLLKHMAPFSNLLGSLWDHALIVYSKVPRAVERVPLPSADAVIAAVRGALET